MVKEKSGKKKFEIKDYEEHIAGSIKPVSERLNKPENFLQYIRNGEKG